jgi:hypothetical protein
MTDVQNHIRRRLNAAIGSGRATGSSGALQSLAGSGPGRIALGAIALGLACYVVWRAVGAILNPEKEGAAKRAFYALTALVHAGLAIEAARIALSGGAAGSSSSGAQSRTASLMQQPFGIWLVAAVGAAILGYGLYQFWKGWTADLSDRLALSRMGATARRWAVRAGRLGLAARGVVFGIIGVLLITAAVRADPQQAEGLGGALRTLQGQPYGPWLLGVVAIGLFAYGVYMWVQARYRRIGSARGAGAVGAAFAGVRAH